MNQLYRVRTFPRSYRFELVYAPQYYKRNYHAGIRYHLEASAIGPTCLHRLYFRTLSEITTKTVQLDTFVLIIFRLCPMLFGVKMPCYADGAPFTINIETAHSTQSCYQLHYSAGLCHILTPTTKLCTSLNVAECCWD